MTRLKMRVKFTGLGSERVSRCDFAVKSAEIFELDKSLVTPACMNDLKIWVANRPRDSSLSVDEIRKETGIEPPSFREVLKLYFLYSKAYNPSS